MTVQTPRQRRRGSRHEVRTWLGKDLYDRLLREASARELNLSQCVRESLREYFEMKCELATAMARVADESSGAEAGTRLAHNLLDGVERRLTALFSEQAEDTKELAESTRLIACMLDQTYLGLVARLSEVP